MAKPNTRSSAPKASTGDKRKRDKKDSPKRETDLEEKPKGEEEGAGDQDDQDTKDDKSDTEEPPTKSAKTSAPLDWLLSSEAFDMANPEIPKGHGEVDWADGPHKKEPPPESAGKHEPTTTEDQVEVLRYPHSPMTPFQNLVAACLLSKPFSHRLGLRTIQTLLNPPFGIRTVADLDEAGYEGRRKIMWEARTQHKEKTASQLGDLVEGVKELCGSGEYDDDLSDLKGLKEQLEGMKAEEAQEEVKKVLTKIKGIGPGVVGIFLRRVQADWPEVFPYADDRSLAAARKFGIISEDEDVKGLADVVGGDKEKLVRLLDTLIGLDLEKVMDKAMEKAGV